MGSESESGFDLLSDPEERRVLYAALDSFRQYRQAAHYNITHLRRQSFYSLPAEQIELLSSPPFSLSQTFRAVDDAIDSNADLSEAILKVALESFGVDANDDSWKGKATASDMDKARSTIRQFFRDWSLEGHDERQASHQHILTGLKHHLSLDNAPDASPPSVLVPGAGLGRLVLEICGQGYAVEGNEISFHQLMASNYILNFTHAAGQHKVFPWALNFSNHLTRANQLRSVAVPDVHPATELQRLQDLNASRLHFGERMSMTAGDFGEVYQRAEYAAAFDAVVTCFFIDTAPNLLTYIATIRHCLKTGGVWINLGPLLWHFESAPTPAERDEQRRRSGPSNPAKSHERTHEMTGQARETGSGGIGEPGSFELSNDEVLALVTSQGFDVLEQNSESLGPAGYISDTVSMLQTHYMPAFWVAAKK